MKVVFPFIEADLTDVVEIDRVDYELCNKLPTLVRSALYCLGYSLRRVMVLIYNPNKEK